MGRLPGAIDDGLVYHALNRGNNRGDVLAEDQDREAFFVALGRTRERYPFRLFGYCLMSDHWSPIPGNIAGPATGLTAWGRTILC